MENENELVENSVQNEMELEAVNGSRNMGEAHLSDASEALELEESGKAIDYHSMGKSDLVDLLKETLRDTDFRKVDALLKDTKQHFDDIRTREREEALKRFIETGGRKDDFEYRAPDLDVQFDANFKLLRDKRNQHFREQEESKTNNYNRKVELLEKLRSIVDAEDTEQSFHDFKELQKEWKAIGAVPNAQAKTLWANYVALVDRFYDNRSIYFELKELDRRKNLEQKIELCAKAEKLLSVEKITEAVKELNDLHNEFKHIGPVPKEEKESVWQRFKAASDAVYTRRDEFVHKVNRELEQNLQVKVALADSLVPFSEFQSDRIKEWNAKTQEILAIQKKWDGAGAIPRSKSKEVNKKFWGAFKSFFNSKSQFFKKLDEERQTNLQLKEKLVKEARSLKDNTDWTSTSQALRDLQIKWKEIGPVPEKARERVYQEFKDACDYFFNQRRTQHGKEEVEQNANLVLKEEVCAQVEKLATGKDASREELLQLTEKFNNIGFVPRKAINAIRNRFQKALAECVNNMESLSTDEKEGLLLEAEVGNLKNDPDADRKLYQKEQVIRKKITKAENDLAVLKNNLEFFARSKNAEKLREEFGSKIKEASDQVAALKNQLKMLKSA